MSLAQSIRLSEPRAAARGSFWPARGLLLVLLLSLAGCSAGVGQLAQLGAIGPDAILAGSLARLETAAAFHVEATIGGAINAGSLSSLAGGLPIGLLGQLKLDGATATADVDVSNRAAGVSASLPSLFGATADVVLVDGAIYTRVNLLGDKFTKSSLPPWPLLAGAGSGATYGFTDALAQIKAILKISGTKATLEGRDIVAGRRAYRLTVAVPAAWIERIVEAAGGASAGRPDFQVAAIDYWVYVDTMQLARVRVAATSTAVGSVDLDMTLTAYDRPVVIAAPLADQVNGG